MRWIFSLPIGGALLLFGCTGSTGPVERDLDLEPMRQTLSLGRRHACAVATDGAVYCWGAGLLGGPPDEPGRPIRVEADQALVSVAAGTLSEHTCALTPEGAAYCWGENTAGQLGDGSTEDRSLPIAVADTLRFVQLTAGGRHTCGLTRRGRAFCWGSSEFDQLGAATGTRCVGNKNHRFDCALRPIATAGELRFTSIAAGGAHTCGVATDGAGYCWGSNEHQQIGAANDVTPLFTEPFRLNENISFRRISAGWRHTCGLSTDGSGYCWGENELGQVGNGTHGSDVRAPATIADAPAFSSIIAGWSITCALSGAGDAFCWGGGFGNASVYDASSIGTTPLAIPGGLELRSVSAGDRVACGVAAGGVAYCWGANTLGVLGPDAAGSLNPARVQVDATLAVP